MEIYKIIDGKKNKEYYAEMRNGKLFLLRAKMSVRCACTGHTDETATEFKYDENKNQLICPKCNKILDVITPEMQRKKDRENLHLVEATNGSNLGKTYQLNLKISNEEWQTIKEHMFYYSDVNETDFNDFGGGWVTKSPEKVEEILNIKPELRVGFRRQKIQEKKEILEKEIEEDKKIIEKKYPKAIVHIDWSWDDYRFCKGDLIEELKHHQVFEYRAEEGAMTPEYFEQDDVKNFFKQFTKNKNKWANDQFKLIGVCIKRKE